MLHFLSKPSSLAVEKDLTDSKNLGVRKLDVINPLKAITFTSPVIYYGIDYAAVVLGFI